MPSPRCKGLRTFILFVPGLCLASASMAQIAPVAQMAAQAQGDSHEFSSFLRPASEPPKVGPLDEAQFTVLRQGGPWATVDVPVVPPDVRALMTMAREGRWNAVLESIKKDDTPLDVRDQGGATFLTLAARTGQLPAVQELLRRGAAPDRRGLAGYTPLAAAATGGHDLVVLELLRAQADVDLPSANGQPPLHLAARAGHARVVQRLLKAKADPLVWNRDGRHALSEAALGGHIHVMDMLVRSGLPADTLDQNGLNALHAAALGRRFEAAGWLQTHGVQIVHPLTQVLMERPADVAIATP
ncbi:MAG: ankyrin repeat domain-containing protein [Pseudomonadota bacterium]